MRTISTVATMAVLALALPAGAWLAERTGGVGLSAIASRSVTEGRRVDTARPVPGTPTRVMRAEERSRAASRSRRSGRAEIEGDGRGHFRTLARINRREIEVLVDTGASSVAMSRATARRLGVRVRRDDFRYSASTANGRVEMALATLDRVRIGGIELRDVEAAILPDGALDGVLLGMSFLGRLDGFRVEGNRLVMER